MVFETMTPLLYTSKKALYFTFCSLIALHVIIMHCASSTGTTSYQQYQLLQSGQTKEDLHNRQKLFCEQRKIIKYATKNDKDIRFKMEF